MRLRHCLGAVLLLAASAPAMADMYLFDGRAWTDANQRDNALRLYSERDSFANATNSESAREVPSERFAGQKRPSPADCALRERRQTRSTPARCE